MSFRPHRGTVSNLIRASVKHHRSVVTVSVGSKSSASSARNLMTSWTWVAHESQLCSGGGGIQVSASTRNYCFADGIRLIQRNILNVYLNRNIIGEKHVTLEK